MHDNGVAGRNIDMHLQKKPKNRCCIEKHPQAGTKSDIYNLILQYNIDFPQI